MRKILLAGVAIVGFSGAASACDYFGCVNDLNVGSAVQGNGGVSLQANSALVGKIDASTAVNVSATTVGNNLSVSGADANGDQHLTAQVDFIGQSNFEGAQRATSTLADFGGNLKGADVKVDSTVVGNNASIDGKKVTVGPVYQSNGKSPQAALTTVFGGGGVTAKSIDASATAVGNNLSVSGNNGVDMSGSLIGQDNGFAPQTATVNVANIHTTGTGTNSIAAEAVGNNVQVKADYGNLNLGNSFLGIGSPRPVSQINELGSIQTATANVGAPNTVVGGLITDLNVTATAVGNNMTVSAAGYIDIDGHLAGIADRAPYGQISQLNDLGGQTADVDLRGVVKADNLTVDASAVGNNLSISGAAIDGLPIGQSNFASSQVASVSSLGGLKAGGDINIGATAVGNNLSIAAGFATGTINVSQFNGGGVQNASAIVVGGVSGSSVGVSSTAVGNLANISLKK